MLPPAPIELGKSALNVWGTGIIFDNNRIRDRQHVVPCVRAGWRFRLDPRRYAYFFLRETADCSSSEVVRDKPTTNILSRQLATAI